MIKITLGIDGMTCGMCEAHVNDAIHRSFPIKKVSSSHRKKETVILTDTEIEEESLFRVIEALGYSVLRLEKTTEIKKKFLFFR